MTEPLTRAQREARDAFKRIDADKVLAENAQVDLAFHKNRERLKAERLAREAEARLTAKKRRGPGGRHSESERDLI